MDRKLLESASDKFEAYQSEFESRSMQVKSSLLIVSATVLAVTLTLGEGRSELGSAPAHYIVLRKVTIAVNALCTLLLSISLYSHAAIAKRLREALRAKISSILRAPGERNVSALEVEVPRWFSICEKAAYSSFGILIIFLAVLGLIQ